MGIYRHFPYSNFHEMNMDELIKIFLDMQEEWNSTKEEWASYKDYIDNYFNTLDLSEETYNAILRMIENGVFNETVDPVIISEVENWLNENINNGYVVDKTLSISGAAADAKITGDNFKLKVNIPLDEHNQPNNGTDGQVLRTKGNGKTEWVAVGLPTDEQTAQAVSDWLDTHPEATTTVADGSLTQNKFSNTLKLETIKDYVVPEMFGAVGDGVTDDTGALESAFNSGKPVVCPNVYLITHNVQISNGDKFELYGGKFLLNTNGSDDFVRVANYNEVIVKNIDVECTDGVHSYSQGGGTFIHTYQCKSVVIENVKATNINFLYRADYTVTNDETQFFMDSIVINNAIFKDCVCPLLVSFARNVSITNVVSESTGSITRELVYVIGGILNLVCAGIYSGYASRFHFHFNNEAVGVVFDNTLRHNWVEHFSLSDSYFAETSQYGIVDILCPVGEITIDNIVSKDRVYRESDYPRNICEKILITNSIIRSPYRDSVGHIESAYFNNCYVYDGVIMGSAETPIDAVFNNCTMIMPNKYSATGFFLVYGKLTVNNSKIIIGSDNMEPEQIFVSRYCDLILTNNEINVSAMNRLILNQDASKLIIAIGNVINAKLYGAFINQSPNYGVIKNNYLNGSAITDALTNIAVTGISVDQNTLSLTVNETANIIVSCTPANATNTNFSIQNPHPTIVSASKCIINGETGIAVKGLTTGTVTITVTSSDNSSYTATCTVSVV